MPVRISTLVFGAALAACQPTIQVGEGGGPSAGENGLGERCGVQTIISGLDTPLAVAYADEKVFVMDVAPSGAFRILSAPLSGGAGRVLLEETSARMGLIAQGYFSETYEPFGADASSVYWAGGDGSLRRTPVGGGATTNLFTVNGPFDQVVSIVLDDANVYWSTADGALRRSPLAGGDVTTMLAADASLAIKRSLVVDAENIYWILPDTAIMKLPLAGGTPTSLLEGSSLAWSVPWSLALHGDDLFVGFTGNGFSWSPDGQIIGHGSVLKLSTVGATPPESVGSNLSYITSIAADDTGVYFGGGWILNEERLLAPVRHTSPGGSTNTIDADSTLFDMITCRNAICWPDTASGTVKRYVSCEATTPQ